MSPSLFDVFERKELGESGRTAREDDYDVIGEDGLAFSREDGMESMNENAMRASRSVDPTGNLMATARRTGCLVVCQIERVTGSMEM